MYGSRRVELIPATSREDATKILNIDNGNKAAISPVKLEIVCRAFDQQAARPQISDIESRYALYGLLSFQFRHASKPPKARGRGLPHQYPWIDSLEDILPAESSTDDTDE